MREYGQIQCSYWTDPEIQELSDAAVLLGAYLLTGPHSNGIGCYRLPDGYIQADRGWDPATVSKGFAELSRIGFAYRCERTQFVVIPKFLRWNPIANGNVAKAREREFEAVPRKFQHYALLINSLLEHGGHWSKPFRDRLETLSERYTEQDPTQTQTRPYPEEGAEIPVGISPPAAGEDGHDPETETPEGYGHDLEAVEFVEGDPEVFAWYPTRGRDPAYPISHDYLAQLRRTYPAVDVVQELRNLSEWCSAKPRNRKTYAGIRQHLANCLAKAQANADLREQRARHGPGPQGLPSPHDNNGWVKLGAQYGVTAKVGESLDDFRTRVLEARRHGMQRAVGAS